MNTPFARVTSFASILFVALFTSPIFAATWHVSASATPGAYVGDTRQALLAIADDSGKPVTGLNGTSFEVFAFACAEKECGFKAAGSVTTEEQFPGLYMLTVKKQVAGASLGPVAIRVATPLTPGEIASARGSGKPPSTQQREIAFVVVP